jgi:hypothetical protein
VSATATHEAFKVLAVSTADLQGSGDVRND